MRWIFIFLLNFTVRAEINEIRQNQLDSLVTNMDKETLRNLDSLHYYIYHCGLSDEERVFMFYGLFATHYKYDFKRKKSKNQPEYTAYYTAYRRSGVCRDFAALFKELCDRSNIPCVVALGRVKVSFVETIYDFVKWKLHTSNHAWNIVKFNNSWHLMDPTWSTISRIEKFYGEDKQGRKIYLGKVKIPTRIYYDTPSEIFYAERNAVHPAYYILDKVPSYKSSFRKISKRILIDSVYQYAGILDSLATNKMFHLSKDFQSRLKQYSGRNIYNYYLLMDLQFLDLKRSPINKLTVADCENHLVAFENKIKYLKDQNSIDYLWLFTEHKERVKKYMSRLNRKAIT